MSSFAGRTDVSPTLPANRTTHDLDVLLVGGANDLITGAVVGNRAERGARGERKRNTGSQYDAAGCINEIIPVIDLNDTTSCGKRIDGFLNCSGVISGAIALCAKLSRVQPEDRLVGRGRSWINTRQHLG